MDAWDERHPHRLDGRRLHRRLRRKELPWGDAALYGAAAGAIAGILVFEDT